MPRITSLASGLVALFMLACQPPPPKHDEAPVFTVTTPLRPDAELTHEYVAQVNAIQAATTIETPMLSNGLNEEEASGE
jgi:hypothetical protein